MNAHASQHFKKSESNHLLIEHNASDECTTH